MSGHDCKMTARDGTGIQATHTEQNDIARIYFIMAFQPANGKDHLSEEMYGAEFYQLVVCKTQAPMMSPVPTM